MRSKESTIVAPSRSRAPRRRTRGARRCRRRHASSRPAAAPARAAPPCRRRPAARSTGLRSRRRGDRRPRLVAVGVLGQRADEAIEVARFEPVRGGREVEQVGDAEEAHGCPHHGRLVRGDEQRGEAAGAAAHHRGAGRVDPVVAARRADAGHGVGDVDLTPGVVERMAVGAPVPGGTPVVGAQHRPAARHEPADTAASSRRSTGRSGRRGTSTSSGGGRRSASPAASAGATAARARSHRRRPST